MYEYVFAYTDFENHISTYSKIVDRTLSDTDIQKELTDIFRRFPSVKTATLEKVNDLKGA